MSLFQIEYSLVIADNANWGLALFQVTWLNYLGLEEEEDALMQYSPYDNLVKRQ